MSYSEERKKLKKDILSHHIGIKVGPMRKGKANHKNTVIKKIANIVKEYGDQIN